ASRSPFGPGFVGHWREKDMPMLVTRKRISIAVGLLALLNFAGPGRTHAAPPSHNQATADAVAAVLRAHPALADSQIDIEAVSGLVTLTGEVASPALKAQAVALTRQTQGVNGVIDRLAIAGDAGVRAAQ